MNRNIKLVSFSLFLWGVGEGMFLLFLPIYLLKLGAEPILIGIILGGMGFTATITQIPSGYLSDRIGPRPLMWISWTLGMVTCWMMALSGSLNLFVIALLLYGLTGSSLAPMNAYITLMRGNRSAERSLTYTSAAFHLGAVIGPTLGGYFGQHYDLKILFYGAAVLFFISTLLIFLIEAPKNELHHEYGKKKNVFKNTALMKIASLGFISLFFMVLTQNFVPVYLTDFKSINLQQMGYLGTIGSIGNVFFALTLGHLPAKIGFLISFPLTLIFPVLFLTLNKFSGFGLAYFSFGGYRLARTMLLALSREFINAKETGLAYGIIETANGLAVILAPLLCGIVYNQNPKAIFWISSIGIVVSGLINLIQLSKLKRKDPHWL